MRKQISIITLFLFLANVSALWSQERDKDTIDTNVIDVVKPYTPSVSDAFKVKEEPNLDDDVNTAKKEVMYNIFSFPVASTFTPAKGKAAVVDKEKPLKLFDNYASLGFGSYTTILGELYLNHALSRTESVGGYVSHHSSQGGINDVLLDDDFLDTKLNVNYASNLRDMSWNVELGGLHQKYNWYGLARPLFNEATADSLAVAHTFYGAHVGGDVKFEESYLETVSVLFRYFGDDNGSSENRFKMQAQAAIPIADEEISTTLYLDYLGGTFDRNYFTNTELKYGNFNIGLAPVYRLTQDDLTLDLGVSLFYLNDTELGDNKFYIYPNIAASYRLVDEVLIAYGGIKGGLNQNSYYDFSQENPFVSPTLMIMPTDQQYNAYVGLKGKVSNSMSYDIHGSYLADRDRALFVNNDITITQEDYTYGNSFGVVYDDVSTFSVGGELHVDVNRNFTLGLKGDYFIYNVDQQAEAWNLPDIEASLFMDYQIDKHWFAGASLFFVGERKDQFYLNSMIFPATPQVVTLDSYFDINVNVGYHINDRFSVYARGNNLAGNDYARWQNYPVQGIQVLAGATYKFDF
ncbi:TonB-dependent receptor [Hanstruepera flava]|uniref:TonB-dependent receptor n=1 Tax=Hanstruepera flava TaxID=2930218 RepID=UPI0020290C9B|nr:TonB-dependent receptor [Hanstruepera flava]